HDGSAFGEVSTQAYPIGIADAHPCRDHVVGHPRELVDAADSDVHTHGTRAHACLLEAVDRAWTDRGPDDIGEDSEYALEALSVRSYETVREQVKAQVRVVRIARRLGEVVDDRPDHDLAYLANVVGALQRGKPGALAQPVGRSPVDRRLPHIDHGRVGGDGGASGTPSAHAGRSVGPETNATELVPTPITVATSPVRWGDVYRHVQGPVHRRQRCRSDERVLVASARARRASPRIGQCRPARSDPTARGLDQRRPRRTD